MLNDFRPTLTYYLCSPYSFFINWRQWPLVQNFVQECILCCFFVSLSFFLQLLFCRRPSIYYVRKRTGWVQKWHFTNVPYCIYAVIVGGSEKVKKCADVVYGWTLVYVSHAKWHQGHPRVVIYYVVAVWSSPFYFPMQNLERAYYFDKESEAAFWSRFLRAPIFYPNEAQYIVCFSEITKSLQTLY